MIYNLKLYFDVLNGREAKTIFKVANLAKSCALSLHFTLSCFLVCLQPKDYTFHLRPSFHARLSLSILHSLSLNLDHKRPATFCTQE